MKQVYDPMKRIHRKRSTHIQLEVAVGRSLNP